jgi:PAS domain S-box-containing protein
VVVDLEGRITWVNQTFERISGLTLEQLKGKLRADIGVGEETDRFTLDMLRKKMAEGAEFECEIVNYSSHFRKFWLRMQVQPIIGSDGVTEGCFILETDISLRKAEEDQLRMLESVVMHTRDMVLVLDHNTKQPIQKHIVFVNQSFERAMQKQASEVLYTSFYDLLQLEPYHEAFRKIVSAFHDQESVSLDLEANSVKGGRFWLNIALTPLLDSEGVCTHWIAILRDVSSRMKREQEREKLIKELTQNNLDLKQFSFITSHNLRAPLTNLLSIASLLEPTEQMDSDTVKLIDGFKTSTNNLNDILNDLIKIVLIKDSSKEGLQRLKLSEHLNKVVSLLNSQVQSSGMMISSDFSLADEVMFEPSYMDSIIMNLLSNSIRYAHPDRNPEVSLVSRKDDQFVELEYTDNGIGIDLQRYGHKVFGLYQRFSSNPEGKGIGLYLVHSQINALGGEISVASTLNVGTTFTIKLPLKYGK